MSGKDYLRKSMRRPAAVAIGLVLIGFGLTSACDSSLAFQSEAPAGAAVGAEPVFTMTPIGRVVNQKGKPIQLRIAEKYVNGLKGLDEWSHVQVFYWFDKNDNAMQRSILQVYPRGNRSNPRTGVFACRSPVRPNLIALSTCKIVGIEGGTVTVDAIDAFDGTPILDLKPYAPGPDSPKDGIKVKVPAWAKKKKEKK